MIATDVYDDKQLQALRAPAEDATNLAAVLGDPELGRFTLTSLVNLGGVHEMRIEIEKFLAKRVPKEFVLVYLSCHGVLNAQGRLYLAAADTQSDLLASTGLDSHWLKEQMEECRARRKVLILDCCFSGAFMNTKGKKGPQDVGLDKLFGFEQGGRGWVVLTASRSTEYSFEGEALDSGNGDSSAGGVGPTGSLFTMALVDGLRSGKADSDKDGFVSVDEAFAFASKQVKERGGTQNPQRSMTGAEGDIFLTRSPVGMSVNPEVLTEALQNALTSPYEDIRIAAFDVLAQRLDDPNPARVLAARTTLQDHAKRDSLKARPAAQAHLDAHPDPFELGPDPLLPPARSDPPALLPTGNSWSLTTDRNVIHAVAFSRDGSLLAGTGDTAIHLWDPHARRPVGEPLSGHSGPIRAVAFSMNGSLLAGVGAGGISGGRVWLWDPRTRRPVDPLADHIGPIYAVAFAPVGSLLAGAGYGGRVWLWDPRTRALVGEVLIGNTGAVYAVAFSPDGSLLAGGSEDGKVWLWDPHSRRQIGKPLNSHSGPIRTVAFSPDGSLLAGVDEDGRASLWNLSPLANAGEILTGPTNPVRTVAFSPKGSLLAGAGHDGRVQLWDPRLREQVCEPLNSHSGPVRAVAFSPDGSLLASSGAGKVHLFEMGSNFVH